MFSLVRLFPPLLTLFFGSKSLLLVYPQVGRAGVEPHFWKEQYVLILFGILLKNFTLSHYYLFLFSKVIFFLCWIFIAVHRFL